MLSQQTLYPEGFTFISPPASPSDIIPPATVQEQMGAKKGDFDLVIAADWAPPELRKYVEEGGKLLLASAHPPEFEVATVLRTASDVKGYIRVRDHAAFPSLKD